MARDSDVGNNQSLVNEIAQNPRTGGEPRDEPPAPDPKICATNISYSPSPKFGFVWPNTRIKRSSEIGKQIEV